MALSANSQSIAVKSDQIWAEGVVVYEQFVMIAAHALWGIWQGAVGFRRAIDLSAAQAHL